jgi:hypothetical protein
MRGNYQCREGRNYSLEGCLGNNNHSVVGVDVTPTALCPVGSPSGKFARHSINTTPATPPNCSKQMALRRRTTASDGFSIPTVDIATTLTMERRLDSELPFSDFPMTVQQRSSCRNRADTNAPALADRVADLYFLKP